LRVGIFAADLRSAPARRPTWRHKGRPARVGWISPALRKSQAQAVYRICQAQDQAWREKRRVRELEELRARSGGIQVSSGPAPMASAAGGGGSDAVRRLQDAKQMLDARLITDAEYEAIKAKIVSS